MQFTGQKGCNGRGSRSRRRAGCVSGLRFADNAEQDNAGCWRQAGDVRRWQCRRCSAKRVKVDCAGESRYVRQQSRVMAMKATQISKLIVFIEENLRASPAAGMDFVDSRKYRDRLLTKQNHVVFGRRGAGKTTLVNQVSESRDHVSIYLNLEDFKDITFPNILIQILLELLRSLEREISIAHPWYRFARRASRVKRHIRVHALSLSDYLHEPDHEIHQVNETASYGQNLGARVQAAGAKGGAEARREKTKSVSRQLAKSKLEFLRIELAQYKALLSDISELLSKRAIYLVLDDYYFVPKRTQPELVDYFHRLTKGTSLFLKLATIKHRSKLYWKTAESYVGVEVGHDIYEVDMDYTLDDFDELQTFMRDLLRNAIERSGAQIDLEDLFGGDGFSQLCLASGGVPRDFLSLFVTLANRLGSTGETIGKVTVNEAAIATIGAKMESMKKDSGDDDAILEDYLNRIRKHVYHEKRTNAFLIAKDELEADPQVRQAVRELVDLRLIHLVDQNTSKAPSDGRRYEAYILDIGLYENSRPRNFEQVDPGSRDDKARKDSLRASPVVEVKRFHEQLPKKDTQLELTYDP